MDTPLFPSPKIQPNSLSYMSWADVSGSWKGHQNHRQPAVRYGKSKHEQTFAKSNGPRGEDIIIQFVLLMGQWHNHENLQNLSSTTEQWVTVQRVSMLNCWSALAKMVEHSPPFCDTTPKLLLTSLSRVPLGVDSPYGHFTNFPLMSRAACTIAWPLSRAACRRLP